MKERTIIKSIVGVLIIAFALATRNTDVIYVAVSVFFFIICIAYAEWCERL